MAAENLAAMISPLTLEEQEGAARAAHTKELKG
jgi:hypothetical protein